MGREIALTLSRQGHRIGIAGRREDKLHEVSTGSGEKIKTCSVDVTDRNSVAELFTWFDQEMGDLPEAENSVIMNGGPNYWDSTSDY